MIEQDIRFVDEQINNMKLLMKFLFNKNAVTNPAKQVEHSNLIHKAVLNLERLMKLKLCLMRFDQEPKEEVSALELEAEISFIKKYLYPSKK